MVAPIRTCRDWRQGFDTIIDVRTPAEFAEDHIPGALNLPVLDDRERAEVGTVHKRSTPFEARRLGARLIATNIAGHIERGLAGHGPKWKPLVYCWRGGQRSGSMARILAEIGWVTTVLEGGYKTYRQQVGHGIAERAATLRPVLLQGPTGTAKTRILRAAADIGAQALDLEGLAGHRGSLLGAEPDCPQPGQRMFESRLHEALDRLDPARPVLVEAESNRIGECQIPRELWRRMQDAPRVEISAGLPARVEFLKRDYAHIIADPAPLAQLIEGMVHRHGHAVCGEWRRQIEAGDWDALVESLITDHYDPAYAASSRRRRGETLGRIEAKSLEDGDFKRLAKEVAALMRG